MSLKENWIIWSLPAPAGDLAVNIDSLRIVMSSHCWPFVLSATGTSSTKLWPLNVVNVPPRVFWLLGEIDVICGVGTQLLIEVADCPLEVVLPGGHWCRSLLERSHHYGTAETYISAKKDRLWVWAYPTPPVYWIIISFGITRITRPCAYIR